MIHKLRNWAFDAILVAIFFAVLYWMFAPYAKAQPTNAAAQQIEINAQVAFGLGYQSNQTLLNYVEPGTTTANFALTTTVFVPPSTTAQAVNLATLFPSLTTALIYGIQDISSPGQAVSVSMKSDGTNPMLQAAGGFSMWRVNCPIANAPTLYLSNSDSANYALIRVICLAN